MVIHTSYLPYILNKIAIVERNVYNEQLIGKMLCGLMVIIDIREFKTIQSSTYNYN